VKKGSPRSAIGKFLALPTPDRRLLLVLWVFQAAASLSLRLRGYKATVAWVDRRTARAARRPPTEDDIRGGERLAELAAIAGHRSPWNASCLRQALAVYGVLRQRNLDPRIALGVDRVGHEPDMHAWVELGGVPLGQRTMRHSRFVRPPDGSHLGR